MGDIVTALDLASQVLESGSDATDVRTRNLSHDILNIEYLLRTLNDALQDAQLRYLSRYPHPVDAQVHEPLSSDLERERKALTGDFAASLRACDALLAESRVVRIRYGFDPATLQWHLQEQEQQSEDLRSRLRLHSRKIRFAMDCLSKDLPSKSVVGLEKGGEAYNPYRLRSKPSGYSARHTHEVNHAVPALVADRFAAALYVDASHVNVSSNLLDRNFDNLVSFLEQCSSGHDQAPEKYLSFLKARWLLNRIEASSEYRDVRPGVYFRYAVDQITQTLNTLITQPGGLMSWPVASLLSLPESCFQIWQSPTEPTPPPAPSNQGEPNPFAARATEENVLSVPLATQGSLTVYKSSEDRFRLVVETALRSGIKTLVPQTLYTREDKLIPRYLLPNLAQPALEMAIFSRGEESLHTFGSLREVHRLQTALTGYDVSHDQTGIRCQFSDEASSFDCCGRIQLWQEPIPVLRPSDGLGSAGSSTIGGHMSDRASTVLGSIAPSLATTHTVHQAEGGWEADSMKMATITIFTELSDRKKRKRLAIVSLELGLWSRHRS